MRKIPRHCTAVTTIWAFFVECTVNPVEEKWSSEAEYDIDNNTAQFEGEFINAHALYYFT